MGRGEWNSVKGSEERKRAYKLAHIVKERYLTFIDSVRDIDGALCLVALFTKHPENDRIPSSLIEHCARLYNEWLLYITDTNSLRKLFLSTNGIYCQAVVQGLTITLIVSWQSIQTIPLDVDVRVMLTILELYQTLLGFVFFKQGTKSRRISNKDSRQAMKEISSTTTDPSQPSSTVATSAPMDVEEDEDFVRQTSKSDPNASSLPIFKVISATSSTNRSSHLFQGLNSWLSTETPR